MSQSNTPMMAQYQEIKDLYPDTFLFYRLGDFYELFNEDAIEAAKILELTLTTRNKKSDNPVPMCGVPAKAVDIYLQKMIDSGHKVAICEQLEDPKTADGVVKRGVIKVVTPGTNITTNENDSNYLVSVAKNQDGFLMATADISTGEIFTAASLTENELINEILNMDTHEVVVEPELVKQMANRLKSMPIVISAYANSSIKNDQETLLENILVNEQKALRILLSYINDTQKVDIIHLKNIEEYQANSFLEMSFATRQNLELTENISTHSKKGSLLDVIDNTKTAMGSRLLKRWIRHPLINANEIKNRQNLVNKFVKDYIGINLVQDDIRNVYDLERIIGKVSFGSVNGKDLLQLKQSLQAVVPLKQTLIDRGFDDLAGKLNEQTEITELLERAISEDASTVTTQGNLIKRGFNEELDKYFFLMTHGKEYLAELQAKEREATNIPTLKISFNNVFGYYIEVTKSHVDKVPLDRYQRKQTLSNSERYFTTELKEKEDEILNAKIKAIDLQATLFEQIRLGLKDKIKPLQELAENIAFLDVIVGFSRAADSFDYVMPEINVATRDVLITQSRHPVVEQLMDGENYIPNDVRMDDEANILIITGPNMSGKSTYMKQLALIVVMNQIGSFVPAEQAKLPIFNKIFTRIGAGDNLLTGESTFMVEMNEAQAAIQDANKDSLIIFDELGRGTATYDGMAIAQGIIEYINDNIKAKTLFSTHYHELTELEENEGIKNVHVGAVEKNEKLIFLHQIIEGPADKSYGIHVAKLAGMPKEVIKRAEKLLSGFEKTNSKQIEQIELIAAPVEENDKIAMQIKNEIEKIDIYNLTPLEAMNKLNDLKKKL